MSPRISVILVVKNGAPFFRDALESISAQTVQPHEIIVVDGHSTDDTPELARAIGARLFLQPDEGLAQARNLGLAHATGDYIAFLDGDDLWAPEKLGRQLRAMQTGPALGYVTTRIQLVVRHNASPEWLSRAETASTRTVPILSAVLARRDLFASIGTFNPAYPLACDQDWFTRARDAHVPTLVIPHVLTYKRLHGSNRSNRAVLTRRDMFRIARDSIARQQRAETDV